MERLRPTAPRGDRQHRRRLRARVDAHWRCPYCHADLVDDTPASECNACGVMHHVSCFAENRGCSVHGCESHRARTVRVGAGPTALGARVQKCSHCSKALDTTGLVARCGCGRVSHPLCYEVIGRCAWVHCAGMTGKLPELMSYSEALAIPKRATAAGLMVLGWVILAVGVLMVCAYLAIHDTAATALAVIGGVLALGSSIPFLAGWIAREEANRLEAAPPPRRPTPDGGKN